MILLRALASPATLALTHMLTGTSTGGTAKDAMQTDVYRSYSLMDVAFWDFGKPSGEGSFVSKWTSWLTKPPATPTTPASAFNTTPNMSASTGTPAVSASGAPAAPRMAGAEGTGTGTWTQWMFGSK